MLSRRGFLKNAAIATTGVGIVGTTGVAVALARNLTSRTSQGEPRRQDLAPTATQAADVEYVQPQPLTETEIPTQLEYYVARDTGPVPPSDVELIREGAESARDFFRKTIGVLRPRHDCVLHRPS